jgi:hypothetical protein
MKQKLFNPLISLALSLLLLVVFFIPVTKAAMFVDSNDGVVNITDTDKTYENLYVAGSTLTLKTPIKKDLYLAASSITLTSSVERSGFVAGSAITISDSSFGQGLKVAGSNITISNTTIEEDLFIAGSEVTLTNVTIKGDLVIGTTKLVITNSSIQKNMYYSGPKDESIKAQVKGAIYQDQEFDISSKGDNKNKFFGLGYFDLIFFVSSLLILAFEVLTLKKYSKLRDSQIGFDKSGKTLKHFAIGLVMIGSIFSFIVISIISAGLLAPVFLNLALILTLLLFLIAPLTSYYLANLIFGNKIVWWSPFVIFLTVTLLTKIPTIGLIFELTMTLFSVATIGYYLQNMYIAKITWLKNPLNNTKTQEQQDNYIL